MGGYAVTLVLDQTAFLHDKQTYDVFPCTGKCHTLFFYQFSTHEVNIYACGPPGAR